MRQHNARRYEKLFEESGLRKKIGLRLPQAVYREFNVDHYHIYNQFIIRVPNRDALRRYLRENGIGSEIYYPVPLHLQECYQSLGYNRGDIPEAEKACQENLGLPIYPELTKEQQETVVKGIKDFYNR